MARTVAKSDAMTEDAEQELGSHGICHLGPSCLSLRVTAAGRERPRSRGRAPWAVGCRGRWADGDIWNIQPCPPPPAPLPGLCMDHGSHARMGANEQRCGNRVPPAPPGAPVSSRPRAGAAHHGVAAPSGPCRVAVGGAVQLWAFHADSRNTGSVHAASSSV